MAVEWTRQSGETVENLVAVLLCRRFPTAQLIRPSRGDGGIDILVPLASGGSEVYQVKKFHSNLTSSQKGQITKSFNRFMEYREESGLDVRAWHLTLPLNPTKENISWLEGVTRSAAFASDWRGQNFVESLASEFPDVIDYYLHDGADRLATAIKQMTNALALKPKEEGSGQVTPAQLADHLRSMYPLLDTDPHFRYGISLDPAMPLLPVDPDLIVAVSSSATDPASEVVTVKVFPRFAAALEFRPIPMTVTFHAEPGTQFAEDLAAFHKYGTPLQAPTGSAGFTAELPGGLGGTWTGGSAEIGPSTDANPGYQIRLAAVGSDRTVQAEVHLNMVPATVGVNKTGVRAQGTDRQGFLNVETLIDLEDQSMKFKFAMKDVAGRRPAELLDSVRFLLALRPPNELAVASLDGPITNPTIPITADPDGLDVGALEGLLLQLETLVAIQAHTTVQLVVPRQDAVNADAIRAWITVRRLLEGAAVEPTESAVTAHLSPDVDQPEGAYSFAVISDLSIRVGDQVLDLGQQVTHCAAGAMARESSKPHEDHIDITLRAVEGTPLTTRLLRHAN